MGVQLRLRVREGLFIFCELRLGAVELALAAGDLRLGVGDLDLRVGYLSPCVLELLTVLLYLGPAVCQLLLAVGYLGLCVVYLGLRLVQRVLHFGAERLVPQLRPLGRKRLERGDVLVLGGLIIVGEVVNAVEFVAVYVGGGVAVAVIVRVEGTLVECDEVLVRAKASVGGAARVLQPGAYVDRQIDDGRDGELRLQQAAVVFQRDGVSNLEAALRSQPLLDGGLVCRRGQLALYYDGRVHGLE